MFYRAWYIDFFEIGSSKNEINELLILNWSRILLFTWNVDLFLLVKHLLLLVIRIKWIKHLTYSFLWNKNNVLYNRYFYCTTNRNQWDHHISRGVYSTYFLNSTILLYIVYTKSIIKYITSWRTVFPVIRTSLIKKQSVILSGFLLYLKIYNRKHNVDKYCFIFNQNVCLYCKNKLRFDPTARAFFRSLIVIIFYDLNLYQDLWTKELFCINVFFL